MFEDSSLLVRLSGSDSLVTGWQWQPSDNADNTNTCNHAGNLAAHRIAPSLRDACTRVDDCDLGITESVVDGETRFNLQTPRLRAPVALAYRLTANDENNKQLELSQLICVQSINEAPLAQDDHYVVMRNQTLLVDAENANNLLANDIDDNDVHNNSLHVDSVPAQSPRHADVFELRSDGGFAYRPGANAPLAANGSISDRFVYAVTDGQHRVFATATISVVAGNRGPQRHEELPDIELILNGASNVWVNQDLAAWFSDADNDSLLFSVTDGSLPPSGALTLSSTGNLTGAPGIDDIGNYQITVVASDGIDTATGNFTLSIARFGTVNRPPVVDDIANRIVQYQFHYDIAEFFDDPDDDLLSFSAQGLPAGVHISLRGSLTGSATPQNRGTWFILVTASDGVGGSAQDGFRLIIN